jgi:alpha-tubulin suppressor-like RCC1 family protein
MRRRLPVRTYSAVLVAGVLPIGLLALIAPGATAVARASVPAQVEVSAVVAGGVEGWGFNASGELGDGALGTATSPVTVEGLRGVTAIAAGGHHSLALLSNGTVMAWGQNDLGQLGDGSISELSTTPVLVKGLSDVIAVSAGDGHSLALLSDGTVMAWGENSYGQLGDGVRSPFSDVPVTVPGLSGVVAVTAGDMDSFAVLASGGLMAWGDNDYGELGVGKCCDSFDHPVSVKGISGVVRVASDAMHTVALLGSGTVMTWGDGAAGDGSNDSNYVPVSVPKLAKVAAVTAGDQFDLALLANGTVRAWGDNNLSGELGIPLRGLGFALSPVAVPGLSGITAISSGAEFSLAVTATGTLFGWGDNTFGQMLGASHGSQVDPAVALRGISGVGTVSAGGLHALVTTSSPIGSTPPGPSSYLLGPMSASRGTVGPISALSGSDAWGLSNSGKNGTIPDAAHWNGTAWKLTKLAVPTVGVGDFNAIYAANPTDVWVAGTIFETAGNRQTLIENWNGKTWSIVPSPDPTPEKSFGVDALSAISGSGPDDIWAVGYDYKDSQAATIKILLAHYNGTAWSAVTPPRLPGNVEGDAVADASPSDVWAVGTNVFPAKRVGDLGVALHYDGTTWKSVPMPTIGDKWVDDLPRAVTIAANNDIWITEQTVNVHIDSGYFTDLLNFNGNSFTVTAAPPPDGQDVTVQTALWGITSLRPDDIYADGFATYTDGAQLALTYHYNGTTWSVLPGPQPGDDLAAGENPYDVLLNIASTPTGAVFESGVTRLSGLTLDTTNG